MKKRPSLVSLVSWVTIIGGILSLGISVWLYRLPDIQSDMVEIYSAWGTSLAVIWMLIFGSEAILIVSGFGMLAGKNWARYLFIAFQALVLAGCIINSAAVGAVATEALAFGVFVFILFSPSANTFFSPAKPTEYHQEHI